jgi:hypothetical protein
MWASFVIVLHPGTQRHPQISLVQRDHEIQVLPPHRSNQPFTICIRLWCPHWSAQNLQFKITFQFLVQLPREDRVAIVDQELLAVVTGKGSRNCCNVQAAVGWSVTLECKILRVPISSSTKTYS